VVMSGLSNEGALTTIIAAFRASIAAQIATLPVLWVVFGELSLTSLPANVLIAPLIGLAFPLAALAGAAGSLWEPLAAFIALPARMCADLVFDIVDRLGGSDRALATIGEASAVEALLICGVAVSVILLMSDDARRWLNRVGRGVEVAFSTSGPGPVTHEPGPVAVDAETDRQ
jgi:predicted membrane metal-binding protein